MKSPILLSLLIIIALLNTACASLSPCSSQRGFEAGYQQAISGQQLDFSKASSCSGSKRTVFEQQMQAGFEEGLSNVCRIDVVRREATEQGLKGQVATISDSYMRCDANYLQLKAEYEEANLAAIERYCGPSGTYQRGFDLAATGNMTPFKIEDYQVCPRLSLDRLEASYREGLDAGQKRFCAADSIFELGEADGKQGLVMQDRLVRYASCDSESRELAYFRYRDGYMAGLERFCRIDNHLDAIESSAQSNQFVALDVGLQRCISSFAELESVYEWQWKLQRQQYKQAFCSASVASAQARKDAYKYLASQAEFPMECDADDRNAYLNAYAEAWQLTKRTVCELDSAYGLGQQAALQSLAPYPEENSLCPQALFQEVNRRFSLGFKSVSENKAQ